MQETLNASRTTLNSTMHQKVFKTAAKPSSRKNNEDSKCRSFIGFTCALLSAFLYAAAGLLVLYVREAGADEIQMTRSVLQYMVSLPIVQYRRKSFFKMDIRTNIWLGLSSVAAVLALWSANHSLKFIPLGDSTSVCYSYVALLGLFECLCLRGGCFTFSLAECF